MPSTVDILEERVAAAAELIVSLRAKVRSLERELTTARARDIPASPEAAPLQAAPPAPPDTALVEEIERLRAERAAARESVRELIREIDRVSW
jgi:hypothetical protein